MPQRLLVVTLAVAASACGSTAAATADVQRWRRPVDGRVVGPFAYDREAPFDAGRRRGIDLRAPRGTTVRAACTGRVRFAGRLPGGGQGLSLACGPWVASHLGLRPGVRRRQWVRVGDRVGASTGATVRLGARRASDRFGYVDPRVLLRGDRSAPPALAPLGGRRGPRTRRGAAPRVVMPFTPAGVHGSGPERSGAAVQAALAFGVVLIALGGGWGVGLNRAWRDRRAVAADRVASRTAS